MTFALDHASSKYVENRIKYGYIYGVFSRAVPRKSRYFVHSVSTRVQRFSKILHALRQKRKFWSRVNYQETFAHTRIRFGHVRARVAEKRHQTYSKTISWLRCSIGFSLVRSAVMCLRGSRSSFHHPTSDVHMDVAISESRVPMI